MLVKTLPWYIEEHLECVYFYQLCRGHGPKLVRKFVHRVEGFHKVLIAERFVAARGQRLGGACGILDLPPIDLAIGELLQFVVAERSQADIDACFCEERAPHLRSGILGEVLKMQRDMDTG